MSLITFLILSFPDTSALPSFATLKLFSGFRNERCFWVIIYIKEIGRAKVLVSFGISVSMDATSISTFKSFTVLFAAS